MKTVVIDCYELREESTMDGVGPQNIVGYTDSYAVAEWWKQKDAWKTYLPYKKTFNIISNVEEFKQLKAAEEIESIKKKLTRAELQKLVQYIQDPTKPVV